MIRKLIKALGYNIRNDIDMTIVKTKVKNLIYILLRLLRSV